MSRTEPEPSTDSGLIRGLQSGDTQALRRLMSIHWSPLVAFAFRTTSGTGDPEALVQEAFIRVWSRRSALREEGSLRAFLYTIVRNLCLDELRKQERRVRAESDGPAPVRPRTPYEDVHGAELQRVAAAAVDRLPEKRQEVFRMVREEGLSYAEVAAVLGLSTQTVANHMSLALADLRTSLRPYLAEPQREDRSRDSAREPETGPSDSGDSTRSD